MTSTGAMCPLPGARAERRGVAWVLGAFLICPCHLPITLWLAAGLLSGTAAGAVLSAHPVLAGAAVTVVWLAATCRGMWLLNGARGAGQVRVEPT